IRFWDMQAEGKGSEVIVLNARARAEANPRAGRKAPPPLEAKVATQQATRVLEGHREWILGLALSRDGRLLVSGDDGGQVVVWDQATGKVLKRWKVKGWVYALALSPDTKQVLVSERLPLIFDSGRHAGCKLWDRATGEMQRDLEPTFKGMHIAA